MVSASASYAQGLFAGGPSFVEHWLNELRAGKAAVPVAVHLFDLAQLAGFQSQSAPPHPAEGSDLEWARVAVALFEEGLRQGVTTNIESATNRAMLLRVRMIGRYGNVSGDVVLDADIIRDWFYRDLRLSGEEAVMRGDRWRELPLEQIRELRRIKNRLSIIQALAATRKGPLANDLREWLSIRERLP